ncbi:MAG: hypothetical protein KME64_16895 [Scytonematopsis contorta HA4267-MV1]|nr:hypothetical protein [Scytonematopsis contorta HA4267-MV1]
MSAFPTRDKLVMMLCYESIMDESGVTIGSEYENIVFQLVGELESQGKLIKLIQGANKENPGNCDLKYVNEKMTNC